MVERIWVLLKIFVSVGNTGFDDFQVVFGILELLFGLAQGGLPLLELLLRYHAFGIEGFGAFELLAGLVEREPGHRHAGFGGIEGSHFGNDLHRSDDVALFYTVAGLAEHLGNDTRDLGLDEHLVAGFDLAGGDHELFERVEFGLYDRVDYLYRTGLLPQEHERSEQQRRKEHTQKDFQKFFIAVIY